MNIRLASSDYFSCSSLVPIQHSHARDHHRDEMPNPQSKEGLASLDFFAINGGSNPSMLSCPRTSTSACAIKFSLFCAGIIGGTFAKLLRRVILNPKRTNVDSTRDSTRRAFSRPVFLSRAKCNCSLNAHSSLPSYTQSHLPPLNIPSAF